MRIATPTIFERGVSAMLDNQADLSHTELQLATGRRVLSPSEDPAAAARILDLNREVETVTQFQRNIERARSRLELEDATLDGADNLLQRVRELTVQAANETYSAADRVAISYEIEQLRDEMLGLANTRDANGEYIFAGYQGGASPAAFDENPAGSGSYRYNGDLGQRLIRISHDRQIADGDNGHDVFVDIATSLDADGDGTSDGSRDLFETLNNLVTALQGGGFPPAATPAEDANNIRNYLTDLDLALDSLLDTRAKAGARINALTEQEQVNEDFLLSMQNTRSAEEDLDYAEAVSRFQQQLTALQAAQQSFTRIQDLNLFNFL